MHTNSNGNGRKMEGDRRSTSISGYKLAEQEEDMNSTQTRIK